MKKLGKLSSEPILRLERRAPRRIRRRLRQIEDHPRDLVVRLTGIEEWSAARFLERGNARAENGDPQGRCLLNREAVPLLHRRQKYDIREEHKIADGGVI